ncbi:histidine kinase N-terminal 7TM domain-containing protein [Crassaminicella profunda]|uniref:sensor histidine kinase n=1 Tax=Crassaminicella profunda TaxID=1286698 RepID=UPI001CA64D22|nr:histidine kinase N-terminal 7TM domain-containing protein [Crassaminicella profunda]QZY53710.1 hypothetical protein K7H06_11625 [Crassaminicella profunda]
MDLILKQEIATICIVHIIAIIISIIAFVILYMKANRDHALKSFLVLQISMIAWMVFKIFKTVSHTEMIRWSFIVAYYACTCILEVAFLEFGYAYYKGKPLPKKIRFFIYILPIVQFLFVLTNPYHYLFYKTYDFWGDSFGILFYIHTALEYLFILVGTYFCSKVFKEHFKNKNVFYKYLVVSAIVVPLILNFLYITKVIHSVIFSLGIFVIFDITPIVFTWASLIFVYATFKHDFFSLSPIMRHEIVHKLDTPIGILNSAFEVSYINERLETMISEEIENFAKEVFSEDIKKELRKKDEIQKEIVFNNLILIITIKVIKSIKETQYALIIRDISPYKSIETKIINKQNDLNVANKKLEDTIKVLKETSKAGARNYVARELHDIIGHSLVVTIKLLEVAKLYFNKDKKLSIEALNNATLSIDTGIKDMNAISTKESLNNTYTGELLKKDLTKMMNHVKKVGVKTNLHFKGTLYIIDEKVFDIIKKVCTELVTNSLKHSQASEVFISVNIKKTSIDVLFVDNGIGSEQLVKGNGLTGIEDRLKLVGGEVQFNTSKGEGFMSKIVIKER